METAHETTDRGEQTLVAELSQSHERLDALVSDLRGLERELEGLSGERKRHGLLEQVCSGLEELEGMGGAALFWGERQDQARTHVDVVRGRIQAFEKRVAEIEDKRELVLEEIERGQRDFEFLQDDLYELRQEEESRKREWLIEREVVDLPVRDSIMPWARGGEDDKRFRKALAAALLLSILLGVVFPLVDIPVLDRWEAVEVPERLTRLIREEQPLPPVPPPVRQETKPEETVEPQEQQQLAKESSTAKEPTPKKAEAPKGILAFREKFSGLAESKPAARLGAQARIRRSGKAASGRAQRSLVAMESPGASGGIDVGSLSRDVGGGGEGIEGVEIARATSSIGTAAGEDRPLSNGPGPARTDEEIQIVFDRHKAALYRLYNRELRRDPTLKGQIVLRIRIEPDGSVSLCEVQSSDMKAPDLAQRVVGRVEKFDFGAKEGVAAITILYPIDFLPAA